MGEVYRARDTKLNRDVAIKILLPAVANDPDRLTRFSREAQVLASLNHPNIAHIYGLEDAGDVRALVMELVEGPTLADRLTRGALPLDEGLPIAKQIAEALEAAHEQGIIHRDLKPANVKVRPDGTVKVLDFGLAKAMDSAGASSMSAMMSPTISIHATQAGIILGTAAYMSPEQAAGKPVDRRADLWAFGVVLLEMLTGRQVFVGETVSHVVASVLKDAPDLTTLPPDTPAVIRRLLRRCLQKDRTQRLQSAGDARLDIEEAASEPSGTTPATAIRTVHRTRERIAWSAALAAVVVAALVIVRLRDAQRVQPSEMRVEITTPATSAPLDFALAPDGRSLVFVASAGGTQRLWFRPLDKADAQPLTGTDDATLPFWSPDSRSVAFFASGKLKKIDISGGLPQVLATAAIGRGGSWNADGTILFSPLAGIDPIMRIPATGGNPTPVTRAIPGHASHRFPQFLPDGRRFLFYVQSNPDVQGIYLASLDGGEAKRLTAADTDGLFLRPDRLLFVSQGRLVAQRLDLTRGEVLGSAETLADHVAQSAFFHGAFSVSDDGRIAYRAGGERTQLVWYDRTGKLVAQAAPPDTQGLLAPELSPDGNRVAVDRTVEANRDVWLMDLIRNSLTRFTFDPSVDGFPVWSPDGKRIAFESTRHGRYGLYVKPSSLVGAEVAIGDSPNNRWPLDWSKDAQFLLYHEDDSKTGSDVWALPMTEGDRKAIAVANTRSWELTAAFSPDGRWVAYDTNESGQFQIVVQPFPNPTGKWQISTDGGTAPRWARDGKEVYFVNAEGKLMAAPVRIAASSFDYDAPVPLFQTRIYNNVYKQQYAVAADGRFLINQVMEEASPTPITLLLNWKAR